MSLLSWPNPSEDHLAGIDQPLSRLVVVGWEQESIALEIQLKSRNSSDELEHVVG